VLLTLVLVLFSFRKLIATVLIGTYIHRVLVIDGIYVPNKKFTVPQIGKISLLK